MVCYRSNGLLICCVNSKMKGKFLTLFKALIFQAVTYVTCKLLTKMSRMLIAI